MLSVGKRSTCAPLSLVSWPNACPTRSIKAVFHDAASAISAGKQADVTAPAKPSLPRAPWGPSVTFRAGMPSRSMGVVCHMSDPASSATFSWSVIWLSSSSTLSRISSATFLIPKRVQDTLERSVVRGYHSQLPWHEDLRISSLVSVSHWLHRRFYVIGRSHCPGRPTFRRKLAKLLGCKPPHIQGGIEIPVDDQPTLLTLIGPMFQRHALFHLLTARTAFGGGKPAGGDEQVSPGVGHFGLEELQQLPHRRIGYRSGELPVGHHPQVCFIKVLLAPPCSTLNRVEPDAL